MNETFKLIADAAFDAAVKAVCPNYIPNEALRRAIATLWDQKAQVAPKIQRAT